MGWTAKISKPEMAVCLCDDLLKKIRLLDRMTPEQSKAILEGLVEGMAGYTLKHPTEQVPDFLRKMTPEYCSGHEVGMTWRKIAKEWEEIDAQLSLASQPARP